MPLWFIFLLAYFVFAGALGVSAYYFLHLIAPLVAMGSEPAFFASGQLIVVTAAALAVIGLLFILLSFVTARPVKKLTNAVLAFSEHGEHMAVVVPQYAPSEIKKLMRAFITFEDSVEATHEHDTQISKVKSDFISTAAHQFRTPLTGIRWALEALGNSELTEEQRTLIANATEKSKELVGIVGALLDISAIESGKYQYRFADTDIVLLVESVVNDFKQGASERHISLTFDRGESIPLITADKERLKWVLTNLVENAVKYTPEGGAVHVTVALGRERVLVSVRDTGIGIQDADRANIFERFYRGKNAAAKENEGNGLGLYIARTVANDHGGDLNFKPNEEGPGTLFTLSLPVHGPAGRARL
jgi:signal transduction histidine kinase